MTKDLKHYTAEKWQLATRLGSYSIQVAEMANRRSSRFAISISHQLAISCCSADTPSHRMSLFVRVSCLSLGVAFYHHLSVLMSCFFIIFTAFSLFSGQRKGKAGRLRSKNRCCISSCQLSCPCMFLLSWRLSALRCGLPYGYYAVRRTVYIVPASVAL